MRPQHQGMRSPSLPRSGICMVIIGSRSRPWLAILGVIAFILGCSSGIDTPTPTMVSMSLESPTGVPAAPTPTESPSLETPSPVPVPTSKPAPRFSAPNKSGTPVILDELLSANQYVVVLFYRGFF